MKRRLLLGMKMMMVTLCIGLFGVIGVGYSSYQQTIAESPITAVIEEVKADPDYVTLEEINTTFLDAVVAVEDHRFYEHGAVDMIAIIRAFARNLIEGEVVQGGSTITQQLAKNLFLSSDQTLVRKLEEVVFAYELEKDFTKEEILELYVNVIYYGDGYTGIQEASRGYFGKPASALTYEEATLLAGLPQAPSRYALSNHYDKAVKRQAQVIAALGNFGR
ncbi:MAG: transglycosylase domain-containing protein [Cellulosilyticaceae bacterium]